MRAVGAMTLAGTLFLAACGGGTSMVSPTPTPTPAASVSGTWTGSGTDSTTANAAGRMMGQSGMGTMTWQLAQTGNTVTGSVSFSGMPSGMPGTFTGTMDADDMMTFTLDMPMGGMMSGGCTADAQGTMRLDPATMTMTGTYTGANSCSGTFADGHMNMARR